MFDMLDETATDGPAAVTDAAVMLRSFNAPDGIAHTSADHIRTGHHRRDEAHTRRL
jgi:hypothetical protein